MPDLNEIFEVYKSKEEFEKQWQHLINESSLKAGSRCLACYFNPCRCHEEQIEDWNK